MSAVKEKLPNAELGIEKFDYERMTAEDFAEYQKIVKSLTATQNYDWVQFKALGVFKVITDQITEDKIQTKILENIKISNNMPINITRMEPRYIEYWQKLPSGKLVMVGLNAQVYNIYDGKVNNGRYYFLAQEKHLNKE